MSKVSRRRRWWWQSESEKMEGGNKLSTLLGPILEPFPVYHIFHMILSLLLPSFPVTKQPCDAMRCNCFLFFFYFRIYCGLYVTHLADLLLLFLLFFLFTIYTTTTYTYKHAKSNQASNHFLNFLTGTGAIEYHEIMPISARVLCSKSFLLTFFLPLVQLLFFSPFHIKENPNTLLSPVVTSQTVPSSGLDTFFWLLIPL